MSKSLVRKGGPVIREKKLYIMEDLKKLVTNGSILGITNLQLVEKYHISVITVGKYLAKIYKQIPKEDIKETEVKIKVMFDKIFRYAQKMLAQAQTSQEEERALRLLMTAIKEYTDFLERFGMKNKVADKVDIDVTQRSVDIQIIDDRRDVVIDERDKANK